MQGRAGPPLSSRGVDQARRAAERLALAPMGTIVASTLQRTAETARIIALELGLAPPALHAGLVERDVGEWWSQSERDRPLLARCPRER